MRFLPAVLMVLAGCASPGPEFFGAQQHRVSVEGTRVAVFQKGDRAQAIRLDRAGRHQHHTLRIRLIAAIEQATGCTAKPGSTSGDSGVITARIDC